MLSQLNMPMFSATDSSNAARPPCSRSCQRPRRFEALTRTRLPMCTLSSHTLASAPAATILAFPIGASCPARVPAGFSRSCTCPPSALFGGTRRSMLLVSDSRPRGKAFAVLRSGRPYDPAIFQRTTLDFQYGISVSKGSTTEHVFAHGDVSGTQHDRPGQSVGSRRKG